MTMSPHVTESQLRRILDGVGKIVDGPGFGTVEIVVEKGRVRRIRTTVEEWLEPRPDGTASGAGGKMR